MECQTDEDEDEYEERLFGTARPYIDGDIIRRRCSRCGYNNVPLIRLDSYGRWLTKKEADRICPGCGQHCSNTNW